MKYLDGSATRYATTVAITPNGIGTKKAMRNAYDHASREATRPAAAMVGVTPGTDKGFPAARAVENALSLSCGRPRGRTALAMYSGSFLADFSFMTMFRAVLPIAPPRKRKVPMDPWASRGM